MPTYRVIGGTFTRLTPGSEYWKTVGTSGNIQQRRHTLGTQTTYPEGTELTDVTQAELNAFPDRFELVSP